MLEISNLTLSYGENVVIEKQNITFCRGVVTGIKGRSGSGKSSLLNVLGLLRTANKDMVYTYDGKRIDVFSEKVAAKFRQEHIGFVFQDDNLIKDFTVFNNIKVSALLKCHNHTSLDEHILETLRNYDMEELADKYPEGLSGGEKQRVTILRALINDCDIILADEPTSSLDKDNKDIVCAFLLELAHKYDKTVIIVSHDDDVINMCDEILLLSDKNIRPAKQVDKYVDNEKTDVFENSKCKNLPSFIGYYEHARRKERVLNYFCMSIAIIFLSVASLFGVFGRNQGKSVKENLTKKVVFINRDSVVVGSEDVPPFSDKQKDSINAIHGIKSLYEFKYVDYDNKYLFPIYPQDTYKMYKDGNDELTKDGVFISYKLARDITDDPLSLVGSEVEFGENAVKRIEGVLSPSYSYEYIVNDGRFYLGSYDEVESIAFNCSAGIYIAVLDSKTDIKKIKVPGVSVVLYDKDARMYESASLFGKFMNIMSVVMVAVVLVLFSLVTKYKMTRRKKEVGILRSFGLYKKDVFMVIGYELLVQTFIIAVFGIMLSWLLSMLISMKFKGYVLFNALTPGTIIIYSLLCVLGAGLLSLVKTSNLQIIDSIRRN